jgi:serine/threonine-protein kinase RsbW
MPVPPKVLTLGNNLEEITRVAEFVDAYCQPLGAAQKDLLALHLALEEAVTNVINHGYQDGRPHQFTVALSATPEGRVTAVVTDDAVAYDPLARPPVDTTLPLEERKIGGLGVHLVKNLMDAVRYERRDGRNILTMELALHRTP